MIRIASAADADALADLCGQLGYPATPAQVVARLAATAVASPASCVLVAEDAQARVVGWLQVAQVAHLTDDAVAEILGLVVDGGARAGGIGAALLVAAETWARARGATCLDVRSRIERQRAHGFYDRAGFVRVKTQAVLRKALRG